MPGKIGKKIWNIVKVLGGVATVLALVFGSLRDASEFFLESVLPRVPTVNEVTIIQLTLIGIGVVLGGLLLWNTLRGRVALTPKKSAESDLEKTALQVDKPEQSVGSLSVPLPLSGFELITDKLTYNVGDTIQVSLRVLSLILGATTIRLISPSGRQLAITTTKFHLSATYNFDLAVVEQSWEKGAWKITAQRGTMFAEQNIEIL
jgi:hypothetical protein